jgi:hypothetical protein
MNRGQRRAQWRNRLRQESAMRVGRVQPGSPQETRMPVKLTGSTHVHIREMEFRGIERLAANRIAASFERELTVLLQAHALPGHWQGNPAQARTAPVRLHSLSDYRRMGEQLARAVFAFQPVTSR